MIPGTGAPVASLARSATPSKLRGTNKGVRVRAHSFRRLRQAMDVLETFVEQHAEVLSGARWHLRQASWQDLAATILVLGALILVGSGAHQMVAPLAVAHPLPISLSPAALPLYTLRTTMRMFVAIAASLAFTFTYATLAAKSRRAEMILIPLLDVLQSVPVLGYLAFTVPFLISAFPDSQLGPELAAIFAIFTSQAWNMAFGFYQSLRTVPRDLDEASRSLRLSAWQRFWRLEVPFAMPGLVWNTMMSMSAGWFFVVASEAITVDGRQIRLPGVGAYVAQAIREHNLAAVGWAIAAMGAAILVYDQMFFRPLVVWSEQFQVATTSALVRSRSWVLDLFQHSRLLRSFTRPVAAGVTTAARARLSCPAGVQRLGRYLSRSRIADIMWFGLLLGVLGYVLVELLGFARVALSWHDVAVAARSGALTLLRVIVLVAVASAVWVPIGIAVGLRPRLARKVQPVAQFLAAFPANLLFPVVVFLIVRLNLTPAIWLSPLMILGAQWYILFNVIAGASALPPDLLEATASLRIRGWRWWRDIMLPGIFPYYVTGAITACGGAWNASIVSEVVRWGPTKLTAGGLGAYISRMTEAGDFPRAALGIAVMSALVIAMNRLLWRPLYVFAERRTRLD